jgi:uncharacterized membrane protein
MDMSKMPFASAVTLSAVTGMRSMMAPPVISWAAKKSGLDLESTPFSAFTGQGIGQAAAALVLGELVAGNKPFVPNQTPATELLSRAASGGAAGAAIFKARRRSMFLGAAVGAVAAVGAAYASYYLRKEVVRRFDVSDRMVALMEDGFALGVGLLAVAIARPEKAEPETATAD